MDWRSGDDRRSFGLRLGADLVKKARAMGGVDTWIYFIQEEDHGPIKVGIGRDPGRRLASLQVGNPVRLKLRSAFKAPAALERLIHDHFSDERMVGEWFTNSEELEALADALRHFTVDEATYEWEDGWASALREYEQAA